MSTKFPKIRKLIKDFWPFIKYCIVGVSGTVIDIGSLYIFVEYLGIEVIVGTVMSFLLAVTNNFVLNKSWTFKNKSSNYRKLYIKFFLVSLVGLGLTVASMYVLVEIFLIWYILAKALTSLLVLTWNFLANKLWTFKLREKALKMPDKFQYELSVVIPAYNEEKRLGKTLKRVDNYLREQEESYEIIVVNDGSSDQTVELVKELKKEMKNLKLVDLKKNQGKGYAVKKGVESSLGRLILFTDADNSTPIEELGNLKQTLRSTEAKVAIGSRYLKNSNVKRKQPRYRIAMGRVGNMLIRLFLIDDIRDTQCGFKLFEHKAAREIFYFQKVRRFAFDMEALVVANNLGYRIVEVPVSWINSEDSRVRPVRDALRTLRDLVYIKLNLWSGRYSSD